MNLRAWNHLVSDMHSQTNSIFKFLDGSRALFIKLLLLDFLNAGLNWLHDRIADVKRARLELARRTNNDTKLGESANSDLSKAAVEWPKRAVVIGEVLVIMCHDLADSANYMIRHLQCEVGQQAEMPCQASANSTIEITQAWKHVSLDISLSCEEVKKQSTQIFNSERGRYGMYNTQIGARASQSATRLTILAGTFLPASLASGILSMQGRVRDIGVKFFDFFGLVLFISMICLLSLSAIQSFTDANLTDDGNMMLDKIKPFRLGHNVLKYALGLKVLAWVYCAIFLVVFYLGMRADTMSSAPVAGIWAMLAITAVTLGVLVWLAICRSSTGNRRG